MKCDAMECRVSVSRQGVDGFAALHFLRRAFLSLDDTPGELNNGMRVFIYRLSEESNMLRNRRTGFTLIELLVVIAIIAILIALLVPAVQKVREAANRAECGNNLKQMGVALHNYHNVNKKLPPSRGADPSPTWAAFILPYLEQEAAYKLWVQPIIRTSYYHVNNKGARETIVGIYFCPTRRRSSPQWLTDPVNGGRNDRLQGNAAKPITPGALGDYACCMGSGTIDGISGYIDYYNGSKPPRDTTKPGPGAFTYFTAGGGISFNRITDGTSNTFLVGEKHIRPIDLRLAADTSIYNGDNGAAQRLAGPNTALALNHTVTGNRFGSAHPGSCQFVMGDGSVRPIRVSINTTTLGYLADRADGKTITGVD